MTPALSDSGRGWVLSEQPWWTDADKADWDLHFKEFFDSAWLHKEWCLECQGVYSWCVGPGWCLDLLRDFERLMEWRQAQILVSKAFYLRTQHQQLRRRTHDGASA